MACDALLDAKPTERRLTDEQLGPLVKESLLEPSPVVCFQSSGLFLLLVVFCFSRTRRSLRALTAQEEDWGGNDNSYLFI